MHTEIRIDRLNQIYNARHMARAGKFRLAADYLRRHHWNIEAAFWILFRKEPRNA